MDFTTTTNLARNGKKEFDHGIKVVMYNNKDIWLVVGKDFYEAMKNSGMIEQLMEEMREANDPTTVNLLKKDEINDRSDAILLEDFRKKYAV